MNYVFPNTHIFKYTSDGKTLSHLVQLHFFNVKLKQQDNSRFSYNVKYRYEEIHIHVYTYASYEKPRFKENAYTLYC